MGRQPGGRQVGGRRPDAGAGGVDIRAAGAHGIGVTAVGGVEPEPHPLARSVVFGTPRRAEGIHQRQAAAVLAQVLDAAVPDVTAVDGAGRPPDRARIRGRRQALRAVNGRPAGIAGCARCASGRTGGRHSAQRYGVPVTDYDDEASGVVPDVDRRVGTGVHDDVGHKLGYQQ